MKELLKSKLTFISAGTASISADGILVTGESTMSLSGLGFSSQGYIYNTSNHEVYCDLTQGEGSYCHLGTRYTANAVEGGYLFSISGC